ncbi:uncharacterized protein TRAVEDRAFT_61331 [Trametes versicolor FP-101664 SS1]|uniref:uncharacterized protein n=1 Tax=Trametes versicolor (strain FP-101664) TaxID=717944 RepID=UPI0004624006|nr:uncharacterized protein TRAVEDRAFT_61331 [Trametes versicolor FP-101664 SS1]EIW52388.1 hypothetical protein TRAVEDRAFT_61331 [Trametes versicolor FP-101664 SS1]
MYVMSDEVRAQFAQPGRPQEAARRQEGDTPDTPAPGRSRMLPARPPQPHPLTIPRFETVQRGRRSPQQGGKPCAAPLGVAIPRIQLVHRSSSGIHRPGSPPHRQAPRNG